MSSRFAFLTRDQIDALHQQSLEEHGGQDGVRDENILESAIGRPMLHAFYDQESDAFQIAALYAHSISENQPFLDGNKRTGIAACLVFLEVNGIAPDAYPDDALYSWMIGMAGRSRTEKQFADYLRRTSVEAIAQNLAGKQSEADPKVAALLRRIFDAEDK